MEILKIEPTPSPNTMKIVLSEKREDNQSNTYTEVKTSQPDFINKLLQIKDVKSIFHVIDFLAIDKYPRADWEEVLPQITTSLQKGESIAQSSQIESHYGEVNAEILTFKNIPYQIKLTNSHDEVRKQLPDIFVNSMLKAQKDDDNLIFLRKWKEIGVRYGELSVVIENVYEEIIALYPKSRLDELVNQALAITQNGTPHFYQHVSYEKYMNESDWKVRLRMLTEFPTPTLEDIPLLEQALNENKLPLRRQAIVLFGMIESKEILPYLYKGLNDKNPAIRRTAGDCISDLGFKEALPEMEKALDDPQKIVRWRAAMFLFEEGGEAQLASLRAHANDNAYEVKLQVEMAISRIENGDEALGSVWKQIANRNNN